ncbi:MAG TPA: metalloregulator ArsR/SmtB family transcription factor [Pseudonocardia sp.]|nr:metalloregulator ArsR/SmtB family transcription factor [Pseudonocardia sp.]
MLTPFEVLAQPIRRSILDRLRERPCLVGELAEQLRLSQPVTSKHLRVLRDAGLVTVRVDGPRRWYALRTEPLTELDQWLAPYRWMWSSRLDRLGTHLDEMPDDEIPDDEMPENSPTKEAPDDV